MTVPPSASLRRRLLLLFAVAISPFVLYATLTAAREKNLRGSFVHAESLARARTTSRELEENLASIDQLLDTAMAQLSSRGTPSLSGPPTDSVPISLSSSLIVAALDSTGNRVGMFLGSAATVDGIPQARRSSIVATAIENARRSRTGTVGWFADEGDERNTKDSVALIVVRPVTPGATPCGCLADSASAVVAVLTDHAVRALLMSDSLPNGSAIQLTGSAGGPIGRLGTSDRLVSADARDSLVAAAAAHRDGTIELQGPDNTSRAIGFSRLQRLPWKVFVGLPTTGTNAVPDQRIRDSLMLALLALVIAGVGLIRADKGANGPIQTLIRDTSRMAAGGAGLRTDVAAEEGDLGALGHAINALATDSEQRQDELKDEIRVATRLFTAIPVPTWITDGSPNGLANGRILQANAAAEKLFGVGPGGLIGKFDLEQLGTDEPSLFAPVQADTPAIRTALASDARSAAKRQYRITVAPVVENGMMLRVVTALDPSAASAMPSDSVESGDAADATAAPSSRPVSVLSPVSVAAVRDPQHEKPILATLPDVPWAPAVDSDLSFLKGAARAVGGGADIPPTVTPTSEVSNTPVMVAEAATETVAVDDEVAATEPTAPGTADVIDTGGSSWWDSAPADVPDDFEPPVAPAVDTIAAEPEAAPGDDSWLPADPILAVEDPAPAAVPSVDDAPAPEATEPAADAPSGPGSWQPPFIERRKNRAVLPTAAELEAAIDAFTESAEQPFLMESTGASGTDVNATVAGIARSVASTFGPSLTVSIACDGPATYIAPDAAAVEQIVSMLMMRARDAMAGAGTLTVATTALEVPSESPVPQPVAGGRYSVLTIADSGRGLSLDAQRRMFEPELSPARAASLTPVSRGLNSVADLARQHDWVITVESHVTRGSTFSVYMPVNVAVTADGSGQSAFERMLSRNV